MAPRAGAGVAGGGVGLGGVGVAVIVDIAAVGIEGAVGCELLLLLAQAWRRRAGAGFIGFCPSRVRSIAQQS